MEESKRIKLRFEEQQKRNPLHSSYINFNMAIGGGKFNRIKLYKMFNELVVRDDYALDEKDEVFDYTLSRNTNGVVCLS